MKKIKEKLKKLDYKFIIINLIIIISYILILSCVGLHGHDDDVAYTYYTNPTITLLGKIKQICHRCIGWNIRIGELLYFTFGAFPLWVTHIVSSIFMIVFINLVVYYSIGKENYKNSKNTYILLLTTYLLFMVVNPTITDIFFWPGGIFNHLFSAITILIAGIPFRNMIDEKNEFQLNKKYVIYLIFCFFIGFGVESSVATLIVAIFVYNLVYVIKYKKICLLNILPLISLSLGFMSLLLLSSTRIKVQGLSEFSTYSKHNMLSLFFQNRLLQICLLILFIIICILFKFKNKKIKQKIYILILTFTSFLAMIISPYYLDRGVFMLDIGISIFCTYIIFLLLNMIKIKKVLSVLSILFILTIIHITYIYRNLFIDYNHFSEIRDNYIKNEIKEKNTFVFYSYDNRYKKKYIYKFNERLINVMDGNSSSQEYMKYKYNFEGDYTVIYGADNILR